MRSALNHVRISPPTRDTVGSALHTTLGGNVFGANAWAHLPRWAASNVAQEDLPETGTYMLSQLGWGFYTLTADFLLQNGHCQTQDTGVVSRSWNVTYPNITGMSPASAVIGSSVNTTISGSDINNAGPGQPYTGATDVIVTQGGQTITSITAGITSQGNGTAAVSLNLTGSGVRAGIYGIALKAYGVVTNSLNFTVNDATPQITTVQQPQPLYPGSSAYITIYGAHFGSAGSLAVGVTGANPCTSSDVSAQVSGCTYCYWSDTQVNALLTAQATADGTYDIQITSMGSTGQEFLQGQTGQTTPQK